MKQSIKSKPISFNIIFRGIVHRDLKPENILTGRDKEKNAIYLVDFGISKYFKDEKNQHIEFNESKPFIGTTRYASISAHKGHELGRKDDLESLAYVLIYLLKGLLIFNFITIYRLTSLVKYSS